MRSIGKPILNLSTNFIVCFVKLLNSAEVIIINLFECSMYYLPLNGE